MKSGPGERLARSLLIEARLQDCPRSWRLLLGAILNLIPGFGVGYLAVSRPGASGRVAAIDTAAILLGVLSVLSVNDRSWDTTSSVMILVGLICLSSALAVNVGAACHLIAIAVIRALDSLRSRTIK